MTSVTGSWRISRLLTGAECEQNEILAENNVAIAVLHGSSLTVNRPGMSIRAEVNHRLPEAVFAQQSEARLLLFPLRKVSRQSRR